MTQDTSDTEFPRASELARILRQLSELVDRANDLLGMDAKFPKDLENLLEKAICLNCGKKILKGERSMRGNHERCYKRTMRQIQAGALTDSEAIAAGLLAPRQPGGGGGPGTQIQTRLDEYLASRDEDPAEAAADLQRMGADLTKRGRKIEIADGEPENSGSSSKNKPSKAKRRNGD